MAYPFNAREELTKFARTLFQPPPDLSVWEWCEANIRLSERESPSMPGRYNTALTPYVREPLQCFADKSVGDLTLCWATQVAKTLTIMAGVCYRLENDPSNGLWVIPNEKPFGTWFADNRWLPMLDNCTPLALQRPPASSHRWKKLEQQFDKVTMSFVGSNSAANLAGRPIGLLVMDETDKFPQQSANQREPGAVENAEERTKTVPFGLHVKTSTPTLMSAEIWQQFRQGDQRYYNLPCWWCGQMIVLNWSQVRWWTQNEEEAQTDGEWDYSKVRANAHYQCQECGKAILDHHKGMMLENGIWKPTNLDRHGNIRSAPGRRSYHLNSLYAPWEKCSFANLAVSWLEKKKTPSGRQKFINSTLAEPWDSDKAYDVELVKSSSYKPMIGENGRTPVMGVDVQESYFWCIVRAFAPNGESWLLHEEKVLSIEGLEEIQTKFRVHPNYVVLDMADTPGKVAKMIVPRRWRGMWGSIKKMFPWVFDGNPPRKLNRIFSTPQTRDPNLGTRFQGRVEPARFVYFSKDGILDALDDLRQARPRRWHIYDGVSKEYHLHMNAAEKRVRRNRHTGRSDFYWYVKEEDHLLTCYSKDVEILTKQGWKFGPEISMADQFATVNLERDEIEYQKPSRIIEKPFGGELVEIDARGVSCQVTPDHRMVVYGKDFVTGKSKALPSIKKADDLTIWDSVKLTAANWSGDDRPVFIAENDRMPERVLDRKTACALVGWFVAEGHTLTTKIKTYITGITQNPGEKADALIRVLDALPWKYTVTGGRQFMFGNRQIYNLLSPCGDCFTRRVPEWVKDSDQESLRAFLEAAIMGDGSTQRNFSTYITISKQLADDICEIALKVGYGATVKLHPAGTYKIRGRTGPTQEIYRVSICRDRKRAALRDSKNKPLFGKLPYVGNVYCATVPNGTLIVRHKGKVSVSGNCEYMALCCAMVGDIIKDASPDVLGVVEGPEAAVTLPVELPPSAPQR